MKKLVTPAFIVAAVVLAGLLVIAGYLVHDPATVTKTVTVTRTVTRTVAVTKWKTKTSTVAAPPSIPCTDSFGIVDPGVVDPGVTQGATTCTISLTSPAGADHLATIMLQAPSGDSSTYQMTRQ